MVNERLSVPFVNIPSCVRNDALGVCDQATLDSNSFQFLILTLSKPFREWRLITVEFCK
jgi:hypothetical protein